MKKLNFVFLLAVMFLFLGSGKMDLRKQLLDEVKNYGSNFSSVNISKESKPYSDKLKALGENGFGKVPKVSKYKEYERRFENQSRIIEAFNSYKEKYPNNPYIPEQSVKEIAAKYSMVVADSRFLNVDIPVVNIDAINNFSKPEGFDGFYVMAPVAMLDLNRAREVDGIYEVDDDPIVFAKVPEGFLFVTAWGEDAIEPFEELDRVVEKLKEQPIVSDITSFFTLTGSFSGSNWSDYSSLDSIDITLISVDTAWYSIPDATIEIN